MEKIFDSSFLISIGMTKTQFDKYIKDAPKKYKVYKIKKKKGGFRTIAHPARNLKIIQRELVSKFETDFHFKIHKMSFAYKKNVSIKDNAVTHLNAKFLLKMDFYDFFNSISFPMFEKLITESGYKISKPDMKKIAKILFWSPKGSTKDDVLSVGAPSSPYISNIMLYEFDNYINEASIEMGIKYSRYADDLTFSGESLRDLKKISSIVKDTLLSLFDNKIIVNELKTVIISPGFNKFVTGITLTEDGSISIGRKRKRLIFSLTHKFSLYLLEPDKISYLRGLLSFAFSIEPILKKRLEKKYGFHVMNKLLKN